MGTSSTSAGGTGAGGASGRASVVQSTSTSFSVGYTEAPTAPAAPPHRFRHVQPPDNEVPVALGWSVVLGRSDDVAVALIGARVYSTGVRLGIDVRARHGSRDQHRELHSAVTGRHGAGPALLLGVAFADGRTATTVGRRAGTDGAPTLTPGGSSGGNRSVDASFFLAPLPPAGPLTVVCAWPEWGVAETTTVLDGDEVQAAARRVQVLWPPEPEVHLAPEPPPLPDLPPGSWFARVLEGR